MRSAMLTLLIALAAPVVASAQSFTTACTPGDSPHRAYRTNSTLLVVPTGSGTPTLWIGIEFKGAYVSFDGGATWTRRSQGLKGHPRTGHESEKCINELGRIVVDPQDSSHLYLQTVESPGPLTANASEFGGIYESRDSGATWTQLTGYGNASGGHGLAIRGTGTSAELLMGVNNSQASWGGAPPDFYNTTGVVYRSTDGGASWTELDQRATAGTGLIDQFLSAAQVLRDATGQRIWIPAFVRAAGGGVGLSTEQVGYLESADGGATWTRGADRLSDPLGRAAVNGDVAPADFNKRLLIASNARLPEGGTGPAMSWYTTDGGVTWQKTRNADTSERYIYVGRYSPHDLSGNTVFGYDPFAGAPGTANQGILKSTDAGATWSKISELPSGVDNASNGVRISQFAFHPTDANTIYAAGSMGYVWRSTDGGVTWTTLLTLDTPVVGGVNTTTPAAPAAPGVPTGTYLMGTSLQLSWTAPTQGGLPTSYIVQTATNAAFTSGVIEQVITQGGPSTVASVSDNVWAPIRFARVFAENAVGRSAASATTMFEATTPRWLNLAAVKSGGTLVSTSGPVTVQVPWSGTGAPAWTASVDVPWLQVTGGTGTGAGQFTLSVVDTTDAIGASTLLAATVLVTRASLGTVSHSAVTLRVTQNAAVGALPFGQVDTPTQDATGVQGAIGVTGWVLDDVGVSSVKVYRNCLAFDPVGACQDVLGQSVVFVGDAAFLAGARTDVESAFQTYPDNHRAGWGYLMLTSMLPHVTDGQAYGGVGALTLSVVATDREGQQRLLGRSSDPASATFATPTQITMANDTIAKPFGAIDTPAQGATVSGTVANFGWALTPDSNTTGGEGGDILIPVNGSTATVFIDSLPVALVTYNQCRGSNLNGGGSPFLGSSAFCDDDVASIFGNVTPQSTFTARVGNPTRHRNLDAGRGAIGSYAFDTATLSNGLHTIVWSVTDSNGRTEGIGSRFFTVLNSGADLAARRDLPRRESRVDRGVGDHAALRTPSVQARTGFDLREPWTPLEPGTDGVRRVRLPAELGRVELRLGAPVTSAHLVVGDELRDLPIGASVAGDLFAWAPPVGYFGPYTLRFGHADAAVDVEVSVEPVIAAAPGEPEIRMFLDRVSAGPIRIEGWALDPQAAVGAGIGAVHVWAHPSAEPARRSLGAGGCGVRSAECAPVFLGEAVLGVVRQDVATAFGPSFAHTGFTLESAVTLPPGEYTITAYVWNVRTQRWEDARSLPLRVGAMHLPISPSPHLLISSSPRLPVVDVDVPAADALHATERVGDAPLK